MAPSQQIPGKVTFGRSQADTDSGESATERNSFFSRVWLTNPSRMLLVRKRGNRWPSVGDRDKGRPQCIEHQMGQGHPETWAEKWPLKHLGF